MTTANVIADKMTTACSNEPSAPHYDTYWRLNTYHNTSRRALRRGLEDKGFTVRPDIRKAELIEVQQRLDRGLLSYEDKRISNAELSRFVRDRRLPLPVASTRKAMVATLLGADEAARFEKFGDLPPELRERVYRFYMGSLPERLFCPMQPPVARACKLLRREALPVFHALVTFELRFYFVHDKYQAGDDISKAELRPCFQTSQFLDSMRKGGGGAEVRLDSIAIYVMEGSMRDMLLNTGQVVAWFAYRALRTAQKLQFDRMQVRRGKNLVSRVERGQKGFLFKGPDESVFSLDNIYKLRKGLERAFLSTYTKYGN
ncbi:hypothetical protein CERZMDRAFT_86390 [Cercospora zeae-maydis SCOH1-5]|uniref:Uncharacterized protein n=1 Tax=Cercospora zeae-maydis SCOH1-5 TaxID=717836 RepID=A0A6A6F9N9_9PEZI|nr:hypothetical protein CERZMDRAFT_86390 [Cercospora zeae-maydis SCOH1-5]